MKKHKLKGKWDTREIWLNDKYLDPAKSQKLLNYCASGFSWGHCGNSSKQLALAIMLELTNKASGYQDLTWKLIFNLPQNDFEIKFVI